VIIFVLTYAVLALLGLSLVRARPKCGGDDNI
jgi:hypothetical protein